MAKAQFVVELGGTATAHPVKVRRFAENPGKSNKTGAETELKHKEHIAEAEAKCEHKAHIGCQRDFTLFCCSCADNRSDEEYMKSMPMLRAISLEVQDSKIIA